MLQIRFHLIELKAKRLNMAHKTTLILIVLFLAASTSAENITIKKHASVHRNQSYLQIITDEEFSRFIGLGMETIERRDRYESKLSSQVTVGNGSLSHIQLLDTLPNQEIVNYTKVASKVVKTSQLVYRGKCIPAHISKEICADFLNQKSITRSTSLYSECQDVVKGMSGAYHQFRRLLPANYFDGIYKMYPDDWFPDPRTISTQFIGDIDNVEIDHSNKLALVQWSQFIEHDISKPVVTEMIHGLHIDCCNRNNFQQQPRYQHPRCQPIIEKSSQNKFNRSVCLNYVRSALAVSSNCSFGPANQINQASGSLDLSQLYGYARNTADSIRQFENGLLKFSGTNHFHRSLLPQVKNAKDRFCAFNMNATNTNCFMGVDSRTNKSPLTILIYTLFLRNHNQIARILFEKKTMWNDEILYQTAKAINIDMYRRIVYNEWLPNVIGLEKSELSKVNSNSDRNPANDFEVSNEFGVAAMRFYYSMMPNNLKIFSESNVGKDNKNEFNFNQETFRPKIMYSASTLNNILDSIIHQKALKMDSFYAESLIPKKFNGTQPSHADILAFDIQRGRDHGIRPYVEYLELCTRINISKWSDLETFISREIIAKLKNVYNDFKAIDLIVGGICERPSNNSIVGPTFKCILDEQFRKIGHSEKATDHISNIQKEFSFFNNVTLVDFICSNSDLEFVPETVFKNSPSRGKILACKDHLLYSRA